MSRTKQQICRQNAKCSVPPVYDGGKITWTILACRSLAHARCRRCNPPTAPLVALSKTTMHAAHRSWWSHVMDCCRYTYRTACTKSILASLRGRFNQKCSAGSTFYRHLRARVSTPVYIASIPGLLLSRPVDDRLWSKDTAVRAASSQCAAGNS